MEGCRLAPHLAPAPSVAEDPLGYLVALREQHLDSGLVTVELQDFSGPCCLELPFLRFQARQEDVHHLQRRLYARRQSEFFSGLLHYLRSQGRTLRRPPVLSGVPIDLFHLSQLVNQRGGFDACDRGRCWREVADRLQVCCLEFVPGS